MHDEERDGLVCLVVRAALDRAAPIMHPVKQGEPVEPLPLASRPRTSMRAAAHVSSGRM